MPVKSIIKRHEKQSRNRFIVRHKIRILMRESGGVVYYKIFSLEIKCFLVIEQ